MPKTKPTTRAKETTVPQEAMDEPTMRDRKQPNIGQRPEPPAPTRKQRKKPDYALIAETKRRERELSGLIALVMDALDCDHTVLVDEGTETTVSFKWGLDRWLMRLEPLGEAA